MFSIMIKLLSCIGGAGFFYYLSAVFNKAYNPDQPVMIYNMAGFIIAGFLSGILFSNYFEGYLLKMHKQVLRSIQEHSPQIMASGLIGLIIGIVFALLVSLPVWFFLGEFNVAMLAMTIIGSVLFGYFGVLVFSRLPFFGGNVPPGSARSAVFDGAPHIARPKVLDTSVIIDGRVLDLVQHGFLEGRIIIPSIVLNEVQGIAGDADAMRRKRGRRGLEVVTKLKENRDVDLRVIDIPPAKPGEPVTVDARIASYAKSIDGCLVTNDFNLGKVAGALDIRVLNINTAAGFMRHSVIPGEFINVSIVKYGKEMGQGIAYLDDGTMVVIENADKHIGESLTVEIKNIMQSVAGRLIFAAVTDHEDDEPTTAMPQKTKENHGKRKK